MSGEMSAACREVLGRVSAYLDGDLNTPACHEIEAHCRTCRSCAELIDGLRGTIGLCQEAGKVPLPEPVRRLALDRVRRLMEGQKPPGAARGTPKPSR